MNLVTIIPPEYDGNGVAKSQGTKVLTDDGEIHAVKSIKIEIGIDEAIMADIELFATFTEIPGCVPRYMMCHPLTGKKKEISAIQFSSGETLVLSLPLKTKETDISDLSSIAREHAKVPA